MSVNSSQQNIEQFKEWYKWFNNKYNRYAKIQQRKQGNKNINYGTGTKLQYRYHPNYPRSL